MSFSSAPGKVILFGEHAVVYGRPALAVPVTQVYVEVEVADAQAPGIRIEAPAVGLDAQLEALPAEHAVAAAVRLVLGEFKDRGTESGGLHIRITSTIPVAAGLGSGAAVSVALIRALSMHLGRTLPDRVVSKMANDIDKLHHGAPSGIDNTVITYAKPVAFVKGKPIETLKVGSPFTLIIADTGLRASTSKSVAAVRSLWEADRPRWEQVFDAIGEIASKARRAIEAGNWRVLGALMNENHVLLQELSVSSAELDVLVHAARAAGALGAKLSGGGRGGNMIAVIEDENAEAISAALTAAGAAGVIITTVA
jgi:mevalonate kinase